VENPNAVKIVFHEWRQMWKDVLQKNITWRQRNELFIWSAGWSHDGSRLTSEELRTQETQPDKTFASGKSQPADVALA